MNHYLATLPGHGLVSRTSAHADYTHVAAWAPRPESIARAVANLRELDPTSPDHERRARTYRRWLLQAMAPSATFSRRLDLAQRNARSRAGGQVLELRQVTAEEFRAAVRAEKRRLEAELERLLA